MKNIYFYGFITIISAMFLFSSCASKAVSDDTQKQTDAVPVAETVAKADELFKEREDVAKLEEAVKLLDRARNPDNRNYEVEWKFAKSCYFLGKQIKDEDKATKIFADGESAGQIASRIEPDKPDGYFWYGANLGEQAKRSPLTKGLTSLKEIREAMEKVIEIEPNYQGASAYDALGRLELETGMIGGKPEKAVEYLEKGLELEKNNDYLRLHLAQAYLAVERKADAKKQLEEILKSEPDAEYKVEYEEIVAEAKDLLKRRF